MLIGSTSENYVPKYDAYKKLVILELYYNVIYLCVMDYGNKIIFSLHLNHDEKGHFQILKVLHFIFQVGNLKRSCCCGMRIVA